jgi:hypothetical protein
LAKVCEDMKKSSILLWFGIQCWAQSYPVTVGFPSTFMRYNDKSGGFYTRGDTWHFSAYTAAGNRFGTYNDGSVAGGNSCNVGIVKLASYDVNNPNATNITVWHHSSFCDNTVGYGTESHGSTDGTNCGVVCTNKSYDPFCVAGHCYLNVFRQQNGAPFIAYDTTLIRSDDLDSSPPHWCNATTLSGGACPSNATTLAGSAPNWITGAGVMFQNKPNFSRLMPVLPANWQDDGVHCPTIEGSNTFMYFLTESGDFLNSYGLRVACANLPNLNPADWQAWDGSTWTSTLSNAAPILALFSSNGGGLGCGASYWGVDGAGTSPAVTYLPAFGRYVMIGQFFDACIGNYMGQHLRLSQAPSLTGPWTKSIEATVSPDVYQLGTNPHGMALTAALTSGAATLSANDGCSVNREPPLPFVVTIDSEQILVTLCSSLAWTITRAYNGTTAAAHSSGANIVTPFHLHPGLVSFVSGTYDASTPNIATLDIAFSGEFDSLSSGRPADDAYGPYFEKLRFQLAPPVTGISPIGNVPLRFSTGPFGDKALPRRGLVRFYDFFDHRGNTLFPVTSPKDLISGGTLNPGSQNNPTILNWDTAGLFINGGTNNTYLLSSDNFPINVDVSTVVLVLKPNSVSVGNWQAFFNVAHYGGNFQSAGGGGIGKGFYMGIYNGCSGCLWYGVDNSHALKTATGVITAAAWNVITAVKTTGGINSTVTLYVNGVRICGPGGTACTNTGGGDFTPATDTGARFSFGLYGNGSGGPCNVDGSGCGWQMPFAGTYAGFGIWNRAMSSTEVKGICKELKAAYARPPRSITLTCN